HGPKRPRGGAAESGAGNLHGISTRPAGLPHRQSVAWIPVSESSASVTPSRRILVVEDEPTIADAVALRLRSEGFAVDIAADGPAGVEACEGLTPDLVGRGRR